MSFVLDHFLAFVILPNNNKKKNGDNNRHKMSPIIKLIVGLCVCCSPIHKRLIHQYTIYIYRCVWRIFTFYIPFHVEDFGEKQTKMCR